MTCTVAVRALSDVGGQAAVDAVVERGVAQAGDQVVWSGLAPGWYALRSAAGSQALVVQP